MVRVSASLAPEDGAKVSNALNATAQDLLREDQTKPAPPKNAATPNAWPTRSPNSPTSATMRPRPAAARPESRPARTHREPTVVVAIQFGGVAGRRRRRRLRRRAHISRNGPQAGLRRRHRADGVQLRRSGVGHGPQNPPRHRHQRLALQVRYGNCCAVPGCDRPFEWCHIHHLDHWEHRGPTNLENLIPVCTRHHTQIHDGRLQIERIASIDHWHRKPEPAPRPPRVRPTFRRDSRPNRHRQPTA